MHDMDWLVKNYASFFEGFGIGTSALISHYGEWQVQSRDTSINHYLWYLFHVLIGESKKQLSSRSDLHRNLHEIYLKMLEFRINVEQQKDNGLVQLIMKNKIQQWQAELSYRFHLQAVSLNCCPHCEAINGRIYEAEQVLQNPYFASEQCTKETGCSCGYIPVAAEEEERKN